MKTLVTVIFFLLAAKSVTGQNLSNRGKEFWVGYGHHQFMEPGQNNSQEMVLYFSAEQPANVTVTINGTAYVKSYSIPANSVIVSDPLPKNGVNDCRLFSVPPSFGGTGGEGSFNRGIHIVSDVPIVAYAHIYGSASSGATMLMPVETWGYTYASVNSQQRYGNNNCFSWLYVVANEDNTVIEITPSVKTRNGRNPNVPFSVTLNKGQIYQVIGDAINSSTGYELTGTKVKSVANAAGKCFPVGVFAGSSRTAISCSGGSGSGDNIMQQIFPFQAWGKRYLTAPTSSSTTASSFHTNIYRVAVKDPAAVVKRNGVQLTGLTNNFYYEYQSNTADYIESDKPILVAQYMASSGSCPNTSGGGDPEMIYISPIEQAIKRTGFFRNDEEGITTNYLTLIIPTPGVASLKIDGSAVFSHTYPHPNLPGYTVVIKKWNAAKAQCIVQSDYGFTAVTYGLGSVESYGYNAGTLINNLNAISSIYNVLDASSTEHRFTCTNTPVELSVLMAYQPTRMQWLLNELGAALSPNADVVDNAPVPKSTVSINGIDYFKYTLPGTYTFNQIDTFKIPILATHPSIENCDNTERFFIEVIVKEKPKADFTFTHSGCTLDTVRFTAATTSSNNFTLANWKWTFPGNGEKEGQMVDYLLPPGTQNVKLTAISADGCVSDTTKQIAVREKPTAGFSFSPLSGCENTEVTFTDTASNAFVNPVTTWYWDMGNGTTATLTANTSQKEKYTAPGQYIVKHIVKSSATCVSDTVYKTIDIYAKPTKPVGGEKFLFCQNTTATALSATALTGHTLTWYTNPTLTGGTTTAPVPPTTTAGTNSYYITQTSPKGCVSDTARIEVEIIAAINNNTISANQTLCSGAPADTLIGVGALMGGSATYAFQWQQSNDGGVSWTNVSGATGEKFSPGVVNTGVTRFRRLVTSGVCSHISNEVAITVETDLSNYEIGSSQTICGGSAPALIVGQTPTGGTGNYTFQWQISSDGVTWDGIPNAVYKDFQSSVLTSNTFFRRITYGGNCPATSAPVLITVKPLPGGTITGPADICSYNTADVVFSASAGTAPFTVQLIVTNPGGGKTTLTQTLSSNGPVSIPVLPANSAAGMYSVLLASVTDNNGCRRTVVDTVDIVVKPQPVVSTINPAPVCAKTEITLSANGAVSYTWTPASFLNTTSEATVKATPDSTLTYQVVGTTDGCHDTATVTVIVFPVPAKPGITAGFYYCEGTAAAPLQATTSPGNTVTWYDNAALTGGVTTAPKPSTATPGIATYYVTQTNQNGCVSDTAGLSVTVYPNPLAAFTLPATICTPDGTATFINNSTITDGSALGYQWTFGDGSPVSNTRDGVHTYAIAGTYPVKLIVSSPYGCTNELTKTISSFSDRPVANFQTSADSICQGQNIVFTDRSTPSGTISKWRWNFGDGNPASGLANPIYRYRDAGSYSVQLTVTHTSGCESKPFDRTVWVNLQPVIDAGPGFTVPGGTTVQFKATANDTSLLKFTWSPGTDLSHAGILKPTLLVTKNETYTLTATSSSGCTATDTLWVRTLSQIEVPNAFSPNGDGINDRWEIPNLAEYPGAKVEVFNRWGQSVFLSYGYNRPWDGSFLGNPLPMATYYYVITLNNGFKPVTGSVTLIK